MSIISARAQAIEDLLREDQSDEESFDYDEFVRSRNRVDVPAPAPTFDEIRDQYKDLAVEPSQPSEPVNEPAANPSRKFAIESDSEDESPERPRLVQIDSDEEDEGQEEHEEDKQDEDDEQDEKNKHNTHKEVKEQRVPRERPRKSRAAAEQELARIKRQLDTDIQLHTKSKPSVADFLVSFRPAPPSDDSDLEIVSDNSCPTSPILPFKTVPDTRLDWFKNIQQLQNKQQARRMDENLKQFEVEVEPEADPEDEPEQVTATLPSETPDAAQNEEDEAPGSPEEAIAQVLASSPAGLSPRSPGSPGSPEPTDFVSSNDTVVNETQIEAPIDPAQLRQLYQRQRRIFNDSDSESEDDEEQMVSEVEEDDTIDRQELAKLSPAQQQEELRRRFQIKRELALELLEEQAMESDEENEFPREQNGDTDEDDDEAPVENLIDDTKQQVHEEELHARYVEHEREIDEKIANSLRKDVLGGAWRTKHLLKDGGILDDDDDDEVAQQFKRARRIQRERILGNSLIGKLAANSKTKAFAESMVEEYISNDTLEDSCESIQESLRFLSEERDPDIPPSSQPEDPTLLEAPIAVPVVVSERKPSIAISAGDREDRVDRADRTDRRTSRDSVLLRALPSTHSVPVLAKKHINRRARISAPQPKPQKVSVKSIGLGYKRSW